MYKSRVRDGLLIKEQRLSLQSPLKNNIKIVLDRSKFP